MRHLGTLFCRSCFCIVDHWGFESLVYLLTTDLSCCLYTHYWLAKSHDGTTGRRLNAWPFQSVDTLLQHDTAPRIKKEEQESMDNRQRLKVKTVGVIGAGVSGVASAIHLRKAGLQVTVFERNPHVGGVWCVVRFFDVTALADFRPGSLTSAHLKMPRIPLRNRRWAIRPSMRPREP